MLQDIWGELGLLQVVAPLRRKGPIEVVRASDQDASWAPTIRDFPVHVQIVRDPREGPECTGEILYFGWMDGWMGQITF